MSRLKPLYKRLNQDERGLASFVIVSVLVVLLTLISIGFARLMDRAQNNALNNQLSAAANYAAQSALKDASAAVIKQLQTGNPAPSSGSCVPPSTYSGGLSNPLKDVYDQGNLSKATDVLPTDKTASYTCILVNPEPTSLDFQQVPAGASEVIKLYPQFTDKPVNAILFGWQASAGTGNTQPPPLSDVGKFYDIKKWDNLKYVPVLRVTLYPVSAADQILGNYTYFMYPTDQNGSPASSTTYTSNGAIITTRCGKTTPFGSFVGTQNYLCNSIINNLRSTGAKYFYARVAPLYVNGDFGIQANYDSLPSGATSLQVAFEGTQATVDVTAKDGTAVKRLQGKVDLTTATVSSTGESNGITPGENQISEYGLQSAAAICKRYEYNSGFVIPTTTGQACKDMPKIVNPPPPTVTLTATPTSVNTGGTSDISWTVTTTAPLKSCNRSSNPAVSNWDSDTSTLLTGKDTVTLTSATTYNFTMTCTDILNQTSAPGTATVTVNAPPAGTVCLDSNATNFGGPLPCQYPSGGLCTDPAATNNGGPLPCQYPSTVCNDPSATNYGGSLPCQYPSPGGCTSNCSTGGAITVNVVCADNSEPGCAWYNTSGLGNASQECHDGLHSYVICISWNVVSDSYSGFPYITYCNVSGFGSSANYFQHAGPPGTPPYYGYSGNGGTSTPVNNFWNVTLGWYTQPSGTFNITVKCFDSANNSGSGGIAGCFDGSCSGGSNNGGGGGSTGGGGPPPPVPCQGWSTGYQPNCTCLYGGTSTSGLDCPPPPPGGGGGGCGLNLPEYRSLLSWNYGLMFEPFFGVLIC